jgi:hypothetical protein
VTVTRLFHDVDVRADAIRGIQAICRKARELAEERGLAASYLATGLARWDELFRGHVRGGHRRPVGLMIRQ